MRAASREKQSHGQKLLQRSQSQDSRSVSIWRKGANASGEDALRAEKMDQGGTGEWRQRGRYDWNITPCNENSRIWLSCRGQVGPRRWRRLGISQDVWRGQTWYWPKQLETLMIHSLPRCHTVLWLLLPSEKDWALGGLWMGGCRLRSRTTL